MTLSNEALRSILPIAGWSDRQGAEVVFAGGADPVLPTPFRIGAAGAAALAATGLAATELWETRTGNGRSAPGNGLVAQRALSKTCRRRVPPMRRTKVANTFHGGMREDQLPAPRLKEHTRAVLEVVGYSTVQIDGMVASGAARAEGRFGTRD